MSVTIGRTRVSRAVAFIDLSSLHKNAILIPHADDSLGVRRSSASACIIIKLLNTFKTRLKSARRRIAGTNYVSVSTRHNQNGWICNYKTCHRDSPAPSKVKAYGQVHRVKSAKTSKSIEWSAWVMHSIECTAQHLQGGAKKTGPAYLIANILKTPRIKNCVEIGELLQYCMLNTVISFLFKNFIALWRHLAKTQVLCDAQIYLYNVNKRQ